MTRHSFNKNLLLLLFFIAGSVQLAIGQKKDEVRRLNVSDTECYAQFHMPDKFEDVTQKVMTKPASQRPEVIPEKYDVVAEQIVLKPAYTSLVPVSAVYETVEEKIMVKPERRRLKKLPAVFETVTEQVLIKQESRRIVPVPTVFETVTEQVLVEDEYKNLSVIPGAYETVNERVKVKEQEQRFVNVPPQFEDVSEQYLTRAASTRVVHKTPQFKEVAEVVEIRPASTKWVEQTGSKNCLSANPEDCKVWCVVEVPAQYKTVIKRVNIGCDGSGVENSGCIVQETVPAEYGSRTKTVLKAAATTRTEEIPAEFRQIAKTILKAPAKAIENIIPAVYKTIQRQIVKTPATFKEEVIPAAYQTVTKRVLKTPERTVEEIIPAEYVTITKKVIKTPATIKEVTVPAVYQNVMKNVLASERQHNMIDIPAEYTTVVSKQLVEKGEVVWKRIICDSQLKGKVVRQIQQGLKDAGYSTGPIDNILGPITKAAIRQFQIDRDLLRGPIDLETATALGVEIPGFSGGFASDKPTKVMLPVGIDTGAPDNNAGSGNNASGNEANAAGNNSNKTDSRKDASKKDTDKPEKNEPVQAEEKKEEPQKDNSDDASMSAEESEMLKEINLLRANPRGYIPFVKAYLEKIAADEFWDAAYKAEEKECGLELIAELEKLGTLSQLKPHNGLYHVSVNHGKDMQSMNTIGHVGSNGMHPYQRVQKLTDLSDGTENLVGGGADVRESVIMLLVDSGIPNRGHRKALLDPRWTHGSCHKVGMVGPQNDTWVQMFGKE